MVNPAIRLALEAMEKAYGNGVLHQQAVTALAALDTIEVERYCRCGRRAEILEQEGVEVLTCPTCRYRTESCFRCEPTPLEKIARQLARLADKETG